MSATIAGSPQTSFAPASFAGKTSVTTATSDTKPIARRSTLLPKYHRVLYTFLTEVELDAPFWPQQALELEGLIPTWED